jgi:large subunit ribosomal protein L32
MRHTRSQTGNRRSHHALKNGNYSLCPKCGAPKMNHTVCLNCGTYKDASVINIEAALAKKAKKQKDRAAKSAV